MQEIIEVSAYVFSGILIIAGIVLTLISLPGVWLIFLGYIITGAAEGFDKFPIWLLIVILILSIASTFIDNLTVMYGTKKFGATGWGVLGAFLGGLAGMFVGGIVGMILGPFVGAVLLELIVFKDVKQSIKAGFGSFLGFLGGIVLKFGMMGIMGIFWLWNLLR